MYVCILLCLYNANAAKESVRSIDVLDALYIVCSISYRIVGTRQQFDEFRYIEWSKYVDYASTTTKHKYLHSVQTLHLYLLNSTHNLCRSSIEFLIFVKNDFFFNKIRLVSCWVEHYTWFWSNLKND